MHDEQFSSKKKRYRDNHSELVIILEGVPDPVMDKPIPKYDDPIDTTLLPLHNFPGNYTNNRTDDSFCDNPSEKSRDNTIPPLPNIHDPDETRGSTNFNKTVDKEIGDICVVTRGDITEVMLFLRAL